MPQSHKHLPHWNRHHTPCFLTWRLAGPLPVSQIADFYTTSGAKFLAADRILDARARGPQWLTRPEIANAVISVLTAGHHRGFYELGPWVIMPNHVHLLINPQTDLPRIVSGIKQTTAKKCNGLLKRSGPFWSRDYFDRWVRSSAEEQRITRYIENNPTKAGLNDWPFSSATKPEMRLTGA